ncbi:unnamed protein product [Boreogadus saida]
MDDERLVVEVEKYVELYDQSSRHYKDNSKKVIAWRAIALEIGSSGDFLHLYCSAAVAPPPVGARGVLLTRVKCAPCRCGASGFLAVELMRGGAEPSAACTAAIARTKRHYPEFFGAVICANTTGHYGAACNKLPGFPQFSYMVVSTETRGPSLHTVDCF